MFLYFSISYFFQQSYFRFGAARAVESTYFSNE